MKCILYLLILGVLATGITSCDSDSTSGGSGSTTKELEVTPSKTSVGIYENFTIKARMTNTPLSDVDVNIDFGDGQTIEGNDAGFAREHSYDKTGRYTVTVTAFDAYTDAQLASKTITIIVSDVVPSVQFTRELIDTTVQSDGEGGLLRVYFPFSCNAPISKVRYQFGEGNSITVYDSDLRSYFYQSPGTYKVIIDVYNDKGDYWASDTMECIIHIPEVTLDMLTSAYNVSVMLGVDGTSSIYDSLQPYDPLRAGIGKQSDSLKRIVWTGNSFTASYIYSTRQNYRITGTISSDLKTLETMGVSIIDSVTYNAVLKYSYDLSRLELCGMNNNVIIYRAAHRPFSTFVSNEYYEENDYPFDAGRIGDLSSMVYDGMGYYVLPPYAYVVFTRK